ncbi:UbiA family prenyltransferase [Streptomyces sp. JJ38]|uniref:UbiA family prenyltransferase n=1 Tax=Streptomyces sp. JJ38 TaxID=2738128 RepID=UPI00214AD567|nr:UbiA family prenyltransferase [Streptomyces sp. JJ38]MBW1598580.1 UbiA family prenyltransferase [Streptomyces sp. JJ38]
MALDTASPTVGDRLRAYAKLGKLSFYDYYLCVLIVALTLPTESWGEPVTWLTLALFVVGQVGVVAATVTFDDVTGVRDGSDARNYTPETGELRDLSRKPLLAGVISVEQAERFGWLAALWGAVFWTLTAVVAPHRPAWVLVLLAVVAVSAVQYSYGLKISYNGGQELLLFASTGSVVLMPYVLLTGAPTGLIVLESVLFGLWSLQVSLYSNMNDVEGDRVAGRRNLATMNPAGRYRVIVAAVAFAEPAAVVAAVLLGAVPAWFALVLLPVFALRARQARAGLGERNVLVARILGIKIHRLGVLLLLVANPLAVYL